MRMVFIDSIIQLSFKLQVFFEKENVNGGLKIRVRKSKIISYFSIKIHVVSTQTNRFNETVLFGTQNTCLNQRVRKYSHFYTQNKCSSLF